MTEPEDGALAFRGEDSDDRPELQALFKNLQAQLPELEALLALCSNHWGYEDPIYRFYHHSFKVYGLQDQTLKIVKALQALAPQISLNEQFMRIVAEGTGRVFKPKDNSHWETAIRPILEAFFHARYFLEMAVKYGRELKTPPQTLPSGWAAVLYLYNLR
jgi:hypothetical protein